MLSEDLPTSVHTENKNFADCISDIFGAKFNANRQHFVESQKCSKMGKLYPST